MTDQPRQPSGSPQGGQYASHPGGQESTVALTPPPARCGRCGGAGQVPAQLSRQIRPGVHVDVRSALPCPRCLPDKWAAVFDEQGKVRWDLVPDFDDSYRTAVRQNLTPSNRKLMNRANRLYAQEQGWEAFAHEFTHEELTCLRDMCADQSVAFDDEVFDALAILYGN